MDDSPLLYIITNIFKLLIMLTFPFNTDVRFTLIPMVGGVKIEQSDMEDLSVRIENKNRGVLFDPKWDITDKGIEIEIQREKIPFATSYNVVAEWRRPDSSFSDGYQDIHHSCNAIEFKKDCNIQCGNGVLMVEASQCYKGTPGVGVPKGGAPGQALVKKTNEDYDTEWKTLSSGGGTGDGNDGKTPVIGSITAESIPSTETPSFSLTHTSNDPDGNPVYTGTIKIPKGKDGVDGDDGNDGDDGIDGKTPVFEIGTVETLAAGSQATASIVPDGGTTEGNPKYKVNFGLPKGANGTGEGVINTGTFKQAQQQYEGLTDKSTFFEFMLIDSVDGISVRKIIYHIGNGIFIDSVGAVVDLTVEIKPTIYYTVSFLTDGGSPVPNPQSVEEGKTATAPANPSKTGYTFLYWSMDGTSAYNFQTPVNGNITLTAKWQEESIPVEYWQVGWNLNGGAWPSNDNHATQVVKGGTLSKPNDPAKSGNIFEGWYAESALTNKIAFPYTVSGDITLYAKWAEPQPEEPNEFKFTAILTEDNQRVYVPLSSSKASNISVDWGDGSQITSYQGSSLKGCYHDYTGAAGDKFQITVTGTVSGFRFDQTTAGNPANLYSIDDNTLQESVSYFSVKGAVNLVKVCANAFQNANITELSFQGCTSLNEIEEGIGAYFEGKGITFVSFLGCSSLAQVPDDFFEHIQLAEATQLFGGCKLTKVPTSLKEALVNCTRLYYMFQGANNECAIPNDLFDLCTAEITDVRNAFAGQSAASKTKMTGDAKALYDVLLTKIADGATTAGCFANSDMSNRNLVPTSWGGTAS